MLEKKKIPAKPTGQSSHCNQINTCQIKSYFTENLGFLFSPSLKRRGEKQSGASAPNDSLEEVTFTYKASCLLSSMAGKGLASFEGQIMLQIQSSYSQ